MRERERSKRVILKKEERGEREEKRKGSEREKELR
jgi:hypothetical protein